MADCCLPAIFLYRKASVESFVKTFMRKYMYVQVIQELKWELERTSRGFWKDITTLQSKTAGGTDLGSHHTR